MSRQGSYWTELCKLGIQEADLNPNENVHHWAAAILPRLHMSDG